MKFFRTRKPKPGEDQTSATATTETAPSGLVSLVKEAAVSLAKNDVSGQRAAVYLVADHSASMESFYASGAMQDLAEKALGMSANLDDDGIVPVIFFESSAHAAMEVSLTNYQGWVQRAHQSISWGSTNYDAAMDAVVRHYKKCGAKDPALVIFQTDGEPNDKHSVEKKLREYSKLPVFWFFVGFGPYTDYLDTLKYLSGRTYGNVGVFRTGSKPKGVSASSLYENLSMDFSRMLQEARAARVLK